MFVAGIQETEMVKISATYKMLIATIGLLLLVAALGWLMVTQLATKEVRLIVDGQVSNCQTQSYTVEEFLEEQNLSLVKEDSVTPDPDKVLTDESEVEIIKSLPFTLRADGKERKLRALPQTVGEALTEYGVEVGTADKVSPALSEPLTSGAEVVINRITTGTEEILEATNFKTKTKGDGSLPAGTSKVVRKGKKGQDKVTYEITYSDGVEISRAEIDRKTVTEPKTRVVAKSTRGMIAGAEYTKKFTVKAYSYCVKGTTASGTTAREGVIAVDPSVIPLGTRVYVEGYGFATAEDTGGNIKGNTIDVYKNTQSQCLNWGVRYVTIYILSD